MKTQIIEQQLARYKLATKEDEDNAFKEIIQEISLFALSRASFFKKAVFMGGTTLRIFHGLPRFSEDLDFSATKPDPDFKWGGFLNEIVLELNSYGLNIEVKDRSETPSPIKKAFIKESSYGKLLSLKYPRSKSDSQIARIRLEIDTNPPGNGVLETQVGRFPLPHSVVCYDLPTLFAGKINALLTRPFTKGRDWFDFVWYVSRETKPNYDFLHEALAQFDSANPTVATDASSVIDALASKIEATSWDEARNDVEFLLRKEDRFTLDQWNKEFFAGFLDRLHH